MDIFVVEMRRTVKSKYCGLYPLHSSDGHVGLIKLSLYNENTSLNSNV